MTPEQRERKNARRRIYVPTEAGLPILEADRLGQP